MSYNKLGDIIKSKREKLSMSQSELAHSAGVSLPTIQQIESGRATNPSLLILNKINRELGLKLALFEKKPNWDYLSNFGLPLASEKSKTYIWNPRVFSRQLKLAILQTNPETHPREYESLLALSSALSSHYPSFLKNNQLEFVKNFLNKNKQYLCGKHLKLKRISLSKIKDYI